MSKQGVTDENQQDEPKSTTMQSDLPSSAEGAHSGSRVRGPQVYPIYSTRELKDSFMKFSKSLKSRMRKLRSYLPKSTEKKVQHLSTIYEKLKTWPRRIGSRRVKDYASQDAQPALQKGQHLVAFFTRKAASFPAQRQGLSGTRAGITNLKRPVSIREETSQEPLELPQGSLESSTSLNPLFVVDFGAALVEPTDLAALGRLFSDTLIQDFLNHPEGGFVQPDVQEPTSNNFQLGSTQNQVLPSTQTAGYLQIHSLGHSQTMDISTQEDPTVCKEYKGIRKKKGKWVAEIRPKRAGKTVWLGTYETEEEAARAYDAGIFYYEKQKSFNFLDSQNVLPELDRSIDACAQCTFIKTQARLLARRRKPESMITEASRPSSSRKRVRPLELFSRAIYRKRKTSTCVVLATP